MLNEIVGQRVGACLSADMEEVVLLGYGVFQGEQPTPADGPIGGLESPCIKLDNGDVVWGYECWWDNEESMKKMVQHYKDLGVPVREVRIADERAGSEIRD